MLELLRQDLLPLLSGEDARRIEAIWPKLFWSPHATAVGPITSLALAAVDTALWDLRCRAAGQPLSVLAGGCGPSSALRHRGRLASALDRRVGRRGRGASVARGWPGVKIKVGKPDAPRGRRAVARGARRHRSDCARTDGRRQPIADRRRGEATGEVFEPLDLYLVEETLACRRPRRSRPTRGLEEVDHDRRRREHLRARATFGEYLAAGACRHRSGRRGPDRRHRPWLKTAHSGRGVQRQGGTPFPDGTPRPVSPRRCPILFMSSTSRNSRRLTTRGVGRRRWAGGRAVEPGVGIAWNRDAIDQARVEH